VLRKKKKKKKEGGDEGGIIDHLGGGGGRKEKKRRGEEKEYPAWGEREVTNALLSLPRREKREGKKQGIAI